MTRSTSPELGVLSARLLDGLTLLLALVALGLLAQPYFARRTSPGDNGAIAGRSLEKALVGLEPELKELGAEGALIESALRSGGTSRVVLFLYSETCTACLRTKPVWNRLVDSLPEGVGVHAVTVREDGGPRSFFASPRVTVWHAASGAAVARAFGSGWVPTTLLLSSGGTIEYARIGVFGPAQADSLLVTLRSPRGAPFR